MTVALRPEILTSLASVRAEVERRLAEVGRYRALLAIQKTMKEVVEFDDLTRPLADLQARIKQQLQETGEYRAFRGLETAEIELRAVLAFLGERRPDVPETALRESDESASEHVPAAGHEPSSEGEQSAPAAAPSAHAGDDHDIVAIAVPEVVQPRAASDLPASDGADPNSADVATAAATQSPREGSDGAAAEDEADAESAPVSTLAYNLASLLVQSLPATQSEPKSPALALPTENAAKPEMAGPPPGQASQPDKAA